MAWTTPTTFVTGNILTASQLNTNVRDNTLALRGAPRCRVHKSVDQTIPHDTVTELTFDIEDIDTHGMHSGSSGHLTVPANWSGDYLFGAIVSYDASVAGTRRYAEIDVNGVLKIESADNPPSAGSGQQSTFGMSTLWFPVAGDFFNVQGYQDTGGDLSAKADGYAGCVLFAYFVGNGVG